MISCNIGPEEDDNGGGITPGPVYPDIDQYPAWSPDGSVIVYYHTGITIVGEYGLSHVNLDSMGLWFISPAGDNKRQFLKGKNLLSPAWSPEGKWIAFVNGAQIFKIKTNGDSLTQLTFEGRNFFPAWSPDGEWMAYDNTNCGSVVEPAPSNSCGILIIKSSRSDKQFVIKGRMPDWSPDGKYLIYIGFHGEIYRVNVNDTTDVVLLTSLNQDDIYATDNKYPKYSPDGTKIVFASNDQIWVMDSDGTNLLQLTQKGGNYPAWSPDGNYIVYTHNSGEFSDDNGLLWIMDSDGENKRQLNFNHGLIFEQ